MGCPMTFFLNFRFTVVNVSSNVQCTFITSNFTPDYEVTGL